MTSIVKRIKRQRRKAWFRTGFASRWRRAQYDGAREILRNRKFKLELYESASPGRPISIWDLAG